MGVNSIQKTFKVMGLGGSQKNECRERRGPRREPWTTLQQGEVWELRRNQKWRRIGVLDSVVSKSPNEENV